MRTETAPGVTGADQGASSMTFDRRPGRDGDGSGGVGTASMPVPGKRTQTEQLVQRMPLAGSSVQAKAAGGLGEADDQVHAIASAGVQGAGAPLPYRDDLSISFGRH